MGGSQRLLVDTGAVRPLSGSAFVKSQVHEMERHAFKARWDRLDPPHTMRGVGAGHQVARGSVTLIRALHDGRFLGYSCPVLEDDPLHPETANIPPLWVLDQMNSLNAVFCSRTGAFVSLPKGAVPTWPAGTRKLQCEKSPSGHWLLGVGHWDKVQQSEIDRVLHKLHEESRQLAE